jgi:hypothetical protein
MPNEANEAEEVKLPTKRLGSVKTEVAVGDNAAVAELCKSISSLPSETAYIGHTCVPEVLVRAYYQREYSVTLADIPGDSFERADAFLVGTLILFKPESVYSYGIVVDEEGSGTLLVVGVELVSTTLVLDSVLITQTDAAWKIKSAES